VLVAQNVLAEVTSPKFLVYRVSAGPVPSDHWYNDRRQGGRLLGEVCHFVDAAQALIGADIVEAASLLAGDGGTLGAAGSPGALRAPGTPGVVPGNDAIVSLRFTDGSLATICYGSALPTSGKEWIEVSAGSRQLVIDDFRSVKENGKTLWKGRQDKGHRACAAAFRSAVTGGAALPTEAMLATTHATIQAAAAGGGRG
jgi:predicted dehydrogenase